MFLKVKKSKTKHLGIVIFNKNKVIKLQSFIFTNF